MIDKVMEYELIDLKSSSRVMSSTVLDRHLKENFNAAVICSEDLYENIVNIDRIVDILKDIPIGIYSDKFIENRYFIRKFV